VYIQSLENFSDERGYLYPLEFDRLPFTPKRVFMVCDVPKGETRGEHAHYETEQFLICLKGKIDVILFDGDKDVKISLSPVQGVHVPKLVWDSQIFNTGDDMLLVLASTDYDREDYIESYSTFKALKERRKDL